MDSVDPIFTPFHLTQQINVRVCVSNKINFMQRIALTFGPHCLPKFLDWPHPIILPLINYKRSFDVIIFILI